MKFLSAAFPFLVLLLACSPAYSGQGTAEGEKPNLPNQEILLARESGPGSEDVRIRLVDGKTGEAIADAEVTFDRSYVIYCIRPPCPTIERKWVRKTDSEGVVTLPAAEILHDKKTGIFHRKETAILVPGYLHGTYLDTDVQAGSTLQAVIELDPKEERDKGNYRLKLLDAKTRRQISNQRVWLTRPPKANIWMRRQPDCLPSKCPEYWVSYETNSLGNIYPRWMPPDLVWIYAEGYEFARPPKRPELQPVSLEKSD